MPAPPPSELKSKIKFTSTGKGLEKKKKKEKAPKQDSRQTLQQKPLEIRYYTVQVLIFKR